ncbi:P-loop containing nucleoside triphosphate hydrolase protein, partial [Hortaea werneckii]
MSAKNESSSGAAPPNEEPLDNWDDDSSSEEEDTAQDGTTNDEEHETNSDASSDEDDEIHDQDHNSRILNSYRRLLSRRVDLVGDYAGDELFLIEGDSMLLRCFSDDKLDFHPGLQLLHAVYNVEHLLSNLVRRKCNFHIVFFDSNRGLCVPPTASDEDACKYYLARSAIIRHMQATLPTSNPNVKINVFTTYDSPDFRSYLATSGPYFVMMHDGAQPEKRTGKHISAEDEVTENSPIAQRVGFRRMVLQFIGSGYNVALVNGLEWRDTKVMTMVLEARNRTSAASDVRIETTPQSTVDVSAELGHSEKVSALTERQQLAVMVVSAMLRQKPGSVPSQALPSLCAAYLLHEALLAHTSLAMRRLPSTNGADGAQAFLRAASLVSEACLSSPAWKGKDSSCDVADCVDGRLFLEASNGIAGQGDVQKTFDSLVAAVEKISGTKLPQASGNTATAGEVRPKGEEQRHEEIAVLPFSNPVFDKHLEPVRLQVDESVGDDESFTTHRIFQELTHWHNVKKPIVQKGPPTKQEERQKFFAERRNQLFMAEMRTYAASLTNAVGKSLEPETIIVGQSKAGTRDSSPAVTSRKGGAESPAESDMSDSSAKGKQGKKAAGGKTAQKNAGKQAMMAQIAEARAKKDETAGGKVVSAWQTVCKNLQADSDPRSKFNRARLYLTTLKSDWREIISAEVELFILSCVLEYWISACRQKEQVQRKEVCALIWFLASNITNSKGLTRNIVGNIDLTVKTLGLPPVPKISNADALPERKLAFTFALPASKVDGLAVDMPSREFQLVHCGPYLERTFDSKPDPRVEFNPDGWQRKVLDGIDANKSVFAVAPTSAGKTFISFYAMRKVLEADDDGVLVYVAPTKALVNQIAAEIQARYSKNFKYGGKSVWAIHTRDYRINNPSGCQVLVTVPHVLQIMLLAPSNANSWSSRVRRIIFDEVHSIGQAEDGVVWEQLLLMAPCPIIALSATVGNPDEFSGWLTDTQKATG